ncbi:hypothetical protein CAPTEDRAFT_214571 [Capitella teleta]|uniref:Uncharacterized protein n=1 Tax=Capitella teleta TaxID=283909 RepID=R7TRP5_CAPTE|nr:hypothetical protein CAPTEDRAFT_214571 [Capitella teleta]|eukprot:ELT96593.1 hypothetical protein CAPTEDRAFT_214571 [Capitella teleta]
MNFKRPLALSVTGNVAEKWRVWKQQFDSFIVPSESLSKQDKVKIAILLTCIGSSSVEIYYNFHYAAEDPSMAAERDKRCHRFNKKAREFRELQLNENVYVQLDPEKSKWQRGNIVKRPTKTQPRSYRVQLPSGQQFQRNRRHIRSDHRTEGGDEDIEDPRRILPMSSDIRLRFFMMK